LQVAVAVVLALAVVEQVVCVALLQIQAVVDH
jgi:hypothetical protein